MNPLLGFFMKDIRWDINTEVTFRVHVIISYFTLSSFSDWFPTRKMLFSSTYVQ